MLRSKKECIDGIMNILQYDLPSKGRTYDDYNDSLKERNKSYYLKHQDKKKAYSKMYWAQKKENTK